jgi:hypothetical protein
MTRFAARSEADCRQIHDSFELSLILLQKELQEELDAGYGKRVYLDYIQAIDKYLIPFFCNTFVDTIDYHKLQKFDDFRRDKLGKYPATSTVNTHNAALRRVFKVAVQNKWMNEFQVPVVINTGTKQKFTLCGLTNYERFFQINGVTHFPGFEIDSRPFCTSLIRHAIRQAAAGVILSAAPLTIPSVRSLIHKNTSFLFLFMYLNRGLLKNRIQDVSPLSFLLG